MECNLEVYAFTLGETIGEELPCT